jgi:hypothetical protein
MKNLTYTKQKDIEAGIEAVLARIGSKSRGRIEVVDGDEISVIEFEGDENGQWKRTSWHHPDMDEITSIFWAFRIAVPFCKHSKGLMEELQRAEREWGQQ